MSDVVPVGSSMNTSNPIRSGPPTSVRLDSYAAIETLERQYACNGDVSQQRVMLLVHLNGNACYAGGAEALLQMQQQRNQQSPSLSLPSNNDVTATTTAGNSPTAEMTNMEQASNDATAADPFSFLNGAEQDNNHPGDNSASSSATSAASSKKGFRNFFSKVAQSTTQRLERGMTHLAIRADRGKSPDRLVVALMDADRGLLWGVTESVTVPVDDMIRNAAGIRFRIPLYIPAQVHANCQLQCHVYLKSGAVSSALWNSKPFLVAVSPRLAVSQLRQAATAAAAAASTTPSNANPPQGVKPTMWTLDLQSNVMVNGKVTLAILPDAKFPRLCGPGWSLADPSLQGYAPPVQPFSLPLDQSYALPLTLLQPITPAAIQRGVVSVVPSTTTIPPPPETSLLLCTERTTESTVVLPLATAWFQYLVTPAVQVSMAHAQGVAAHIAYNRHDTPNAPAVETHITLHAIRVASHVAQSVLGDGTMNTTSSSVMRRVSVHCQRPDSIFEVEWGTGNVVCLPDQVMAGKHPSLPPPATVLAYPKPVSQVQQLLPFLAAHPMPSHGYRVGRMRVQVETPDYYSNGGGGNSSIINGPATALWEGFLDLDVVLMQQTSGQVVQIPLVVADHPSVIVAHLAVTVRMNTAMMTTTTTSTTLQQQAQQQVLPNLVPPNQGLVALVGLETGRPAISQPALDVVAPSTSDGENDEAAPRRAAQLATMGTFMTSMYVDYHIQQVRTVDYQALTERARAYQAAVQAQATGTATQDRLPAHQDRTPRAFRPSSSRSEALLSGIPFNCHTATWQISLVQADAQRDAAYFYNVTCGAPADHARGFGNLFHKQNERLGLSCPVGAVAGGLRRLEAKRLELAKHVDDLQNLLIMQVANFFVTERQKRKVIYHVPTRDPELQHLRWKLFEAVQCLHHTTWMCAVRRANVFSQALGLAVTCFLASLSDTAKWQTWPDLWVKQGFLVTFEGLLSAAGKELGMIEDASVGIDMLKHVQLSLVADDGITDLASKRRVPVSYSPYLKWVHISTVNQASDGSTEYLVELGIVPSYFEQRIPANFKAPDAKIRLYPLLFEVGVDIRQWGAHAGSNLKNNLRKSESGEELGKDLTATIVSAPVGLLDDEDDDVGVTDHDVLVQLNFEAFQKLNAYAHRISPANSATSSQKIHPLLETLHQHILSSSGKINHDILDEAATLSQQLGGGAVVFCKSGKDRTAMHLTYKQAQFANRYKRHWSPEANPAAILETTLEDATIIRTYGTRLPICEKNVGQAKFAFNRLQVEFMPDKLKPPMNTLAGFLKGGKVFSGGGIES